MNGKIQLRESSKKKKKFLKTNIASEFLRHLSLNVYCTSFLTYSRATNKWEDREGEVSAVSRAILKPIYRFGISNTDPQTLKSVKIN